jgi:uncharacterized protein YbjQ (UPF0145 family)
LKYTTKVTAHVVVGKNVFSDIGGSFSEIFGGQFSGRRSKSTLRQLASINDAALKDLRQQAVEGGDGPSGAARRPWASISGGNRPLLVVTATGAALRAERSEDAPRSDQETGEDEPVSARQVEVDWRTRRLLAAADEDSVRLSGGDGNSSSGTR